MRENILAPSILAADFAWLGEEIEKVEKAGAQYLHFDVMDGHFVPNLSLGLPVIRSVRPESRMIFDIHLMVEDPLPMLPAFAEAGADILTVHVEACRHLDRTVRRIHELGLKAGIALNPSTPVSAAEWMTSLADQVLLMSVNPGFGGQKYISYTTEKIRELRRYLDEHDGEEIDIEVDGGVNLNNTEEILEAGANILVAGSAVFSGDPALNTGAFLRMMK